MKILVPIDFSPCSLIALEAAKGIAKSSNDETSIVLYHCMEHSGYEIDETLNVATQDRWKHYLDNKLHILENELLVEGFKVKCSMSVGNFIENIAEHCINNTYKLIVMGSHGASGWQEFLIGSKTQKVIRKINESVLIVKKDATLDFDQVLFVTGLAAEDKEPFIKFLETMKEWEAKRVHLLAINTGGFFGQPTYLMAQLLEDFAALSDTLPVETHFTNNLSIDGGVREFARENGIGLIGISNHTRNPVKRVLRGSNVETIVNHSSVPVLSIDY